MLGRWLGLQDRRDALIFALSSACITVCIALAMLRGGHARGYLLFAASMASWFGGMAIGRRWHHLTKRPGRIRDDLMHRGVRPGFGERLLLRLTIVLGALSIYAQWSA